MKRDGLMRVFETLLEAYGEQGWWPGSSPLEIIVGAILTQRTTWENASRGIERLADSGLLSIEGLARASEETVAAAVRPSGCFRSKARKLKAFAARVEDRYGGDLDRLLDLPTPALRQELLDIYGIGPETADAVLLYAASRPAFVVDAYARRLLERLGVLRGEERYDEVQQVLTEAFPEDVSLFGEFHALIVRHGKARCRSRPSCGDCPLAAECCYVVREGRRSPWKCASIVDA
jgi:endonuclease-3 related protein